MLLRKALPIILVILALAGVAAYFHLTESVTTVVRTEPAADIARNPFSAAQRWMQTRGQESQRILSAAALFPLPDTRTTLLLDRHRSQLTDNQVQQLLQWVQKGGQMIVAARPLPSGMDQDTVSEAVLADSAPLLYPLGITTWKAAHPGRHAAAPDPLLQLMEEVPSLVGNPLQYCLNSDNEALRERCLSLACDAPPQPTPLTLHHFESDRSRRIQLYSDHVIQHRSPDTENSSPPAWPTRVIGSASNDNGKQLIHMSLGSGNITVLTDLSLWDNRHLLYFDHAWLLDRLTGTNPVWFVHSVTMPPLPQWLWSRNIPLAVALLLLLALWLWTRLPRQGPRLHWQETRQQDYLQHLHASGYFLWRTQQPRALLAALRQQAHQRLSRFHPSWDTACQRAAQALAVDPQDLQRALETLPETREQLTQQVALLQRLVTIHRQNSDKP